MAGRKPKPTNLRILGGNAGHRPLPENEPEPEIGTMDAPDGLSEKAQGQWDLVAKQLYDCGLLTELDKPALVQYCEAYARWSDANEHIKTYGAVVKAPSGFPVQSPYLAIANKAFDQMSKLLVEFGMTPSSRTRIEVKPPKKSSSTYANLEAG